MLLLLDEDDVDSTRSMVKRSLPLAVASLFAVLDERWLPELPPPVDEVDVGDEPTTLVVVDLCFLLAAADVVVVVFVVRVWANCTCSVSDDADETSSLGGG